MTDHAAETAAPDVPVKNPGQGISQHHRLELCRALALGEVKRSDLARRYGVTAGAITHFAKRNAARIDAIRADIDNEYAGLWLADKVKRLESYEQDLELSLEAKNASYHEQVRVRNEIRRHMADELGQMPQRGIAVSGTVRHVLEGIDVEDLT